MISSKALPATGLLLIALASGCSETTSPTDAPPLAPSANASAVTRIPFSGTLYGCSGTAPAELSVTPGGVLHFDGATNVNQWVSDNPLVNGIENNVVDANINLNGGYGRAHATGTITPESIAGTWVVHFLVKIGGPFAGQAYGSGYGTGALEGSRIDFTVEPLAGPVTNLCNADFPFVANFTGTITGP